MAYDMLPEGAAERLSGLLARAGRLAVDFAQLTVLDARYSARRAIEILAVVVVTSVLLVTAWLALVIAVTVSMLGAGTSWPGVLAVAAGLNIVAAVFAGLWIKRRLSELPFAATLRQLRGEPPP